jgi:hypothetical protein
MKTRKARALALGSAVLAGAGLAVVAGVNTPALAAGGTGSQLFACTNLQSASDSDHTAPFYLSVATDGTWPSSASPAGSVLHPTVTVQIGIPSEVIAGLKSPGAATQLGLTSSRLHVHLTNATPSDVIINVGAAARVPLPAAGAGPLMFSFPGIALNGPAGITTAGTNGGTVALSIDTSATDDGLGLNPNGLAGAGQADFGYTQVMDANNPSGHGNCVANTAATANGLVGGPALIDWTASANAPAVGTFGLAAQPPSITSLPASYNAIAGQSTSVPVSATDVDGTLSSVTWATGAVSCGSASITGTGGSATLQFTAPGSNGTCTVDVTATDPGTGLSSTQTATFNVLAGSQLNENVNQHLFGGQLTLSACGHTQTPSDAINSQVNPATCYIKMSDAQLNGTNLTSYGFITGPNAPAPLAAGFATLQGAGAFAGSAMLPGGLPVLTNNEITIQDNRGAPAPWTLTGQLEGNLTNSLYPGSTDPNASIASSNLAIAPVCQADTTNANGQVSTLVAPTGAPLTAGGAALPLCTSPATHNGGSFYLDAGLFLSIPQTTYAGDYQGTIDFIVS